MRFILLIIENDVDKLKFVFVTKRKKAFNFNVCFGRLSSLCEKLIC